MEKQDRKEGKLSKLPVCSVEFIKLVIKKMRYRRMVQDDVQAELAAHFEDELKGIKTEAEREEKAKQLVGDFGDVKLLAILLRRAKKRCRGLWRTVVARAFQTVGVLILCFIAYTGWFMTGKPSISVDYLAIINQMNRPQLAEEDNGWPRYERAIELFVEVSEELKKMDVFKNYKELRAFGGLTEEEKEEIKKWVQQNESAWREFVAGSLKAYCYQNRTYNSKDEEKWLFNILEPELGTLRNLSRLGIWRSRIEVGQKQIQKGLEDCLAVIRTGQFWQKSKISIVEQLVGIAISGLGHNEILHIIEQEDLSADRLRFIQEKLSAIYADGYPLMDVEAEKFMFMDVVQHTFTDGGPGGGHLIPERFEYIMNILDSVSRIDERGFGKILLFTGPAMYHAGRDKTVAKANEIYDKLIAMTKMTPYQRHINEVKSEDIILSVRKRRYLLPSIFMPALDRSSELAFRAKALHEATLTVLALKLRYQDKGHYPESLDELVAAGHLKDVPMDPFSDGALVYEKTDDNFTLYSVGRNFKDDGGEVAKSRGRIARWGTDEEGDAVFWPVPKS